MPSSRLSYHKPVGQVSVHLNGRDFYLGAYDTPESRDKYNRLLSEWLANGGRLRPASEV